MHPFTNDVLRQARAALAAGLLLGLAGCNSYSHLTRDDTISPSAGDAVKAAMTIQAVDPWPDYVLDTDVAMDGELAAKRVADYKAGKTKALDGQRSTGGNTAQP